MSLIEAVKANNYELVKTLIDEGADVNSKDDEDEDERTALMIASQRGYKEICELLIDNGAIVKPYGKLYSQIIEKGWEDLYQKSTWIRRKQLMSFYIKSQEPQTIVGGAGTN